MGSAIILESFTALMPISVKLSCVCCPDYEHNPTVYYVIVTLITFVFKKGFIFTYIYQ